MPFFSKFGQLKACTSLKNKILGGSARPCSAWMRISAYSDSLSEIAVIEHSVRAKLPSYSTAFRARKHCPNREEIIESRVPFPSRARGGSNQSPAMWHGCNDHRLPIVREARRLVSCRNAGSSQSPESTSDRQ
jgi:hypothetical protein